MADPVSSLDTTASPLPQPQNATKSAQASARWAAALRTTLAILLGSLVTLAVYGYQFGRGNHGVYLLDALRRANPALLRNDWFTTHTLQYHVIFSELSSLLIRAGVIEIAFAASYALLILLFHAAWRGIVGHLGGGDAAYLISVALYHLSAAGTALGMYQFFQDSCLLPSNIANVALLVGIWMWLRKSHLSAGAWFGIASIFHLNFALIGSALWVLLAAPLIFTSSRRRIIAASAIALVPAMINIAFAAHAKLSQSGSMPLPQFIDLYVRLRHPHHYDPSTWPIGIWAAFAWAAIAALLLLRDEIRRITLFFSGLTLIALIGAGIWYVNETLIQMSLYRFTIYIQLFGTVAAAIVIVKGVGRSKPALSVGAVVCAAIIAVCAVRGPFFGAFVMPRDDAAYVEFCRWVAQNTSVDAVFVVPPDEESMRLIGQRAIVVNYKCVPQLSGELSEWERRLCDVLNLHDLNELPRGYTRTLPAIRLQYDSLNADPLFAAARKYHARYIVCSHRLDGQDERLAFVDASGRYMLYDLQR